MPSHPELHAECVENILKLKPECDRWGMPLMIEPLVLKPADRGGGHTADGTFERVRSLVRQAAEMGADVIKADPTDDLSQYHKVVKVATKPVLVRGGARVSDEEVLRRTWAVMKQGASGIVYGRNIIQHNSPSKMTLALLAIVHADATPEQAMKMLRG
jgi:DhnA family fructose-bisphosphate aldolase class Ia